MGEYKFDDAIIESGFAENFIGLEIETEEYGTYGDAFQDFENRIIELIETDEFVRIVECDTGNYRGKYDLILSIDTEESTSCIELYIKDNKVIDVTLVEPS